jgi:glycerol uptake facilitator-like aquaporin
MNQRALAAEFVGTFMLMSSVLGAAFYSFGAPAGAAGILGVAFSIGLTVMALAFSIGHISGGHSIRPSRSASSPAGASTPTRRSATSSPSAWVR